MTIDAEGLLWVAIYGGGAALRVDPAKEEVCGGLATATQPLVGSACLGEPPKLPLPLGVPE